MPGGKCSHVESNSSIFLFVSGDNHDSSGDLLFNPRYATRFLLLSLTLCEYGHFRVLCQFN